MNASAHRSLGHCPPGAAECSSTTWWLMQHMSCGVHLLISIADVLLELDARLLGIVWVEENVVPVRVGGSG